MLLALSSLTAASALLGDAATLTSPATAAKAKLLYKGDATEGHWVALEPLVLPDVSVGEALSGAPPSVMAAAKNIAPDAVAEPLEPGAPLACGRLRLTPSPMIDCLRCALPKENPQAKEQLGVVIDALLLEWALHVEKSACRFDDLAASGSLASAEDSPTISSASSSRGRSEQ